MLQNSAKGCTQQVNTLHQFIHKKRAKTDKMKIKSIVNTLEKLLCQKKPVCTKTSVTIAFEMLLKIYENFYGGQHAAFVRLCAGDMLWDALPGGPKIFPKKFFVNFPFTFSYNFSWVTGTILHYDSIAYS